MREFIKLQLKLKWGFNRNNNKASAIMTACAALFAIIIALALVWALTFVLRTSISVTPKKMAVLYITIIMAGLTVAATGMQVKRLYRPADLLIAARFPLTPFKMFLSYLIINYIDLCIYTAVLLVPVMIVFGIAMHAITAAYFGGLVLGLILLPLVPFGLSIFIAIPTVYVTNLLEKNAIVRLVLFICVLVGAFVLYYYILDILAEFFIHRNWEEGTLEIWENILKYLDKPYNPAYYVGNVVFFEKFGLGFGALIGAGVVLNAGGIALASAVCANFRAKALDSGSGFSGRRTKLDGYGPTRAIFRYNFKEIIRTKTYSYFYLGVAISTPVMVFFCNRLVTMVGEAQVGQGINFGASMLVIAVFMAMICSFTGTILSVEGKNFYITKLIPVGYRKQLTIKGLLYIAVSMVALIISAIVIACLKFIGAVEMDVLLVTQVLLAIGLVFNGINLNLANPNLKPKANGEAEEINITYMLLIGLVIAGGMGAVSIIFPKSFENGALWAYLICVGVALAYAITNFLVFWFTVENKYRKIEI